MCNATGQTAQLYAGSPAVGQRYRSLAIAGGIHFIREWRQHRRQMRALTALDARLLADIGSSRAEAVQESARSFGGTYARRHMK